MDRDYSYERENSVERKDVIKECHPRDDPNCLSARHMFVHRVSYKSETTKDGGWTHTEKAGVAFICCLTGCLCQTYDGGAYASAHNEYHCNMCRIPDRMPEKAKELTQYVMEQNTKRSKEE